MNCSATGLLAGLAIGIVAAPTPVLAGISAETPAEAAMAAAPMAHEVADTGGPRVNAHYVRLDGYLAGLPDNAARLQQLRSAAEACVATQRAAGHPLHQPAQWPAYANGMRTDTYATAGSTVVYQWHIAYAIDATDCRLLTNTSFSASLTWPGGTCAVDFNAGTATPGCADAPATVSVAPAAPRRGMAARSTASAVRKTILGIDCVVRPAPLMVGTVCQSLGGSFVAAHVQRFDQYGMTLEMDTEIGPRLHAVAARLDAEVSAAVFQPYRNLRSAVPAK